MAGRKRRQWKKIFVIGFCSAGPVVVFAVLAGQCRPAWYQPAALDERGLERARIDAANMADWISGRMVAGEPFEFAVSDQTLNEWMFAFLHHRPDLFSNLPKHVSSPSLSVFDNRIRIGCLYNTGRWRAIATLTLDFSVDAPGRELVATIRGAYLGVIPVPGLLLEQLWVRPFVAATTGRYPSTGPDRRSLSDLAEVGFDASNGTRVRIKNRFVWPNGERPFRIDALRMSKHALHLRIEPLRG